ncbi:MAG: DUF1622 domain-containing protein [Lewinellaceae bacterium]|nr:DUF1622 domain-containing protein [Lewinellaceae bacterium]
MLLLQRLSNGVEILSAVVLMTGFAKGMWGFLLHEWRAARHHIDEAASIAALRPLVGNYILLGLDFYIVSDILSSMLHPEWQELISLAVIGSLRTAIGYFLGREISESTH